jgi:hypothetical protein
MPRRPSTTSNVNFKSGAAHSLYFEEGYGYLFDYLSYFTARQIWVGKKNSCGVQETRD